MRKTRADADRFGHLKAYQARRGETTTRDRDRVRVREKEKEINRKANFNL